MDGLLNETWVVFLFFKFFIKNNTELPVYNLYYEIPIINIVLTCV